MYIRRYRHEDLPAILDLFYQTVHSVNARDYSEAQLDAWAPLDPDSQVWDQRLSSSITYVAQKEDGIVGFADLTANGLVDMLYTHKDHQRQGIATALLHVVLEHAEVISLDTLRTEASITAKPFFLSRGFSVEKEQQKLHRGTLFTHFVMTKSLHPQAHDDREHQAL